MPKTGSNTIKGRVASRPMGKGPYADSQTDGYADQNCYDGGTGDAGSSSSNQLHDSGIVGITPRVKVVSFDRDSDRSVSTDYSPGNEDNDLPNIPIPFDRDSEYSIDTGDDDE